MDPLAHSSNSHTPYNFAFNDPVFYNDPNGDYPEPIWIDPQKRSSGGGGFGAWVYGGPDGFNNYVSQMFGGSPIPGGGYFGGIGIGNFINSALNSPYGGTWQNGQAYFFESDEEAFDAGADYNFQHNSWSNTFYGSYEATRVGYIALKISGELLPRDVVHSAIETVRNKGLNPPDLLAFAGPNGPLIGSPNKLCGFYDFKKTGNGWTGEVTGLKVYAIRDKTNQVLETGWGALCITVAVRDKKFDASAASSLFKASWNSMTDIVQNWLNSLNYTPDQKEFREMVFSTFEKNLSALSGGYSAVSTGPCTRNIPSSPARYACLFDWFE